MNIEVDLIRFDNNGLVPVIVQDHDTGEVLMLAWADHEAVVKTTVTGELFLYSRSRKELWHKGATSGNTMKVVEILRDCDSDALLAFVRPSGPACHTGADSCFSVHSERHTRGGVFQGKLWRYLKKRVKDSPEESYTAGLLSRGLRRVAQKVGEEGVETALATATGDREAFVLEAADLMLHTMVAAIALDVEFCEIWDELETRHKRKTGK
jgi:phosphoribosyl-ATP pyrophosphohydrolase/phosphoribosyl-AMP cyclohydrolase